MQPIIVQSASRPTSRELRVLLAVVEAGSVREAAAEMGLSCRTIESHLDHLREKSGKRHIAQILLHYMQAGLIPEQDPDCAGQAGANDPSGRSKNS